MFQVNSAINSVRTLVDGGCKLDVITQELNPEELTELFKLKGKQGYFLFKESGIVESDIKDLPDVVVERNDKTPSERLRAVLYVAWTQSNKAKTADEFYKDYMDRLIQSVKEKLN